MYDSVLTQDYLKSILEYNPNTGIWIWLIVTANGKIKVGDKAGSILKHKDRKLAYRSICINYKNYRSGRLAWFYMTGEWPEVDIDHHDNDTLNDKFDNLRPATKTQNQLNRRKFKNNGMPKGVRFYKNGYEATLAGVYLGRYKTEEEARTKYIHEGYKKYGEFFNPN